MASAQQWASVVRHGRAPAIGAPGSPRMCMHDTVGHLPDVPLGRAMGAASMFRQSIYSWSVSPVVLEKTLSAVRSGAPM